MAGSANLSFCGRFGDLSFLCGFFNKNYGDLKISGGAREARDPILMETTEPNHPAGGGREAPDIRWFLKLPRIF